jgi:hypothetical protein
MSVDLRFIRVAKFRNILNPLQTSSMRFDGRRFNAARILKKSAKGRPRHVATDNSPIVLIRGFIISSLLISIRLTITRTRACHHFYTRKILCGFFYV